MSEPVHSRVQPHIKTRPPINIRSTASKDHSVAGEEKSTIHQLPVSKGLAGVHMFLNPGASRELHWHSPSRSEWAFVIDGRCQTMVLDPSGASEINNYEPGDLWYFAKGHGHSIQTIGDKPCHFILSFDNGAFSEHGTYFDHRLD